MEEVTIEDIKKACEALKKAKVPGGKIFLGTPYGILTIDRDVFTGNKKAKKWLIKHL